MKTVGMFIRNTLLLFSVFLTSSCFASATKSEIILIGSTPGDELIKTMLTIPAEVKVDFIRWNLIFDGNAAFVLDITYGESKPNTLGFISDKKQTIQGTYRIVKNQEPNRFKEVYQLKSVDLSDIVSLVKINENLFHILTPHNQLMVGNGGWSYSLNRKVPVDPGKILIASPKLNDKSLQLVFEGRTPYKEIAKDHPEMNTNPSLFKMKWKLILKRDSVTNLPTSCSIRNVVDNRSRDVSGRWTIINGTATNPEAIIYKIQVDNLADPILFFAGDGNVLFFLGKNNKPLIGNADFSYTMNRRI